MPIGRSRRQPTWEEVLKRNCIERLKREKAPERVLDELPKFISCGYEAIPEEDIVRMHWWGVFHDKPKVGNFCVRIKFPGGIVTPAQLRGVGELSVRFGRNYAELTTRQNVQVHWVRLEMLPEVFERIRALGLTTKGGCGDTVRNITGCPVAGVNPDEPFDPTPILRGAARLFDEMPDYADLPRKFKISISACPDWCTAPQINCVSLLGVERDGRRGFALQIGGGLASTPRLAKPIGVFVEWRDALLVLRAIIDEWRTQPRYRMSRVRARIKFMMDDLGPEGFREVIERRLGKKLEDLPGELHPRGFTAHMGVHPQRQPGKYFIGFPVPSGRLTGEQMIAIAGLLERIGGDFRITRQQNFILTGVPEKVLDEVLAEMAGLGFTPEVSPLWATSVACTGNPFCNYAVVNAKETLRRLVEHLEAVFSPEVIRELDLSLTVDGCPHACTHHWVGDIGLQGTTLHERGPHGEKLGGFDIYLRGGLGDDAAIARPIIRRVPAARVHLYVERLIRAYLAERLPGERIGEFFRRRSDEELIAIGTGQRWPAAATA